MTEIEGSAETRGTPEGQIGFIAAKVRVVALRTVEEQREGGDPDPIDPAGLDLPSSVPVTVMFHGLPVGEAVCEVVDGRLVAEVTFFDVLPEDHRTLAVGVVRDRATGEPGQLTDLGVCKSNQDRGVPPFELPEE